MSAIEDLPDTFAAFTPDKKHDFMSAAENVMFEYIEHTQDADFALEALALYAGDQTLPRIRAVVGLAALIECREPGIDIIDEINLRMSLDDINTRILSVYGNKRMNKEV